MFDILLITYIIMNTILGLLILIDCNFSPITICGMCGKMVSKDNTTETFIKEDVDDMGRLIRVCNGCADFIDDGNGR